MRAAYRIAGAMRRALAPDGLNIRHDTGARADQDVFHAHLHVIPRYNSDSVQPGCVWGSLPWVEPPGGAPERARLADAIRAALA